MAEQPIVTRTGRGQTSRVIVHWATKRMRFSMSQDEARSLVNALSHVTLMPVRSSESGETAPNE